MLFVYADFVPTHLIRRRTKKGGVNVHQIREGLFTQSGWDIVESHFDPNQAVNSATLFLLGNGYLGYRGNLAGDGKQDDSGCFVTDTWDKADGKWEELCNVPDALRTRLFVDGTLVSHKTGALESFQRSLDLQNGLFKARFSQTLPGEKNIAVWEEKFASLSNRHVVAMKFSFQLDTPAQVRVETGIDGDTWNLNGEHLERFNSFAQEGFLIMESDTREKGQRIVVLEKQSLEGASFEQSLHIRGKTAYHQLCFDLAAGQQVTLTKFMVVVHSNDTPDPLKEALQVAKNLDYVSLFQENKRLWLSRWNKYDIRVEGNVLDQVALRFNTYQSVIATPTHAPLPIGARGLSCQAYQGAAFWDQEIYNLPMYLFTDPQICRNILFYRFATLDGAREKAARLGFEGAFYAWISGKTGKELCPDFFFQDVNTGRPIRNHFNAWQIHISPDIAYTFWQYYEVSGDWDFIVEYGAEVILEVARFLSARALFNPRKDRYEFWKLQGPDEYHENVENNAFTNYQAYYTLKIIQDLIPQLQRKNPREWAELVQRCKLQPWEITLWEDMLQKMYLPKPQANGVVEQFDGFFALEDVVPAHKIKDRLIREDEYYGWPVGVTVFTRVSKQADVVQLLMLHPDLFSEKIVQANYDFYEPRTLHFSSLSPSAYAIVAARLGYIPEAYQKCTQSLFIDLRNTNEPVSGGTFIGGIHTAAAGVAWQMVVMGFAGFRVQEDGSLFFSPRLPKEWKAVSFYLDIRGNQYRVSFDHEFLFLQLLSGNNPLPTVFVGEEKHQLHKAKSYLRLTKA